MDIVRTKLDAPVSKGDLVMRKRLLDLLDTVRETRLTVLQTPAGYGKTTLLSQWHQELRANGHAVAWLAFDATDDEPINVLNYIAGSLDSAGVEFESPLGADVYTTPDSLIALIVNGLERYGAPIHLFLDDVHLIDVATAQSLARLVERAPAATRFIVASRALPDLHLARIRARGQLLELGAEDLRFSAPESARYMAECSGLALNDAELSRLEERTEGWIAGIKLACLALRGSNASLELLNSFSGSRRSVSDFFAEEVLSLQSAEVREFLLKTAILDRFCPSLCEAVTGRRQARQLLGEIEASGLFLLSLDEERSWFRYHHLFSEFLRRRLSEEQPGLEQQLHRRASAWFWKTGSDVEAIEHALRAGDPEHAAELLDQRCQDLTYTGRLPLVRNFARQIPDAVLQRYPRILLNLAWLLTRNLRFDEARGLLDISRERLAELEASREMVPQEIRRLRYLIQHREMVLSAATDDPIRVEQQCQQLIDDYPEERHPYLLGTIYAQLLFARREQYQLADMEHLQATAHGILSRSDYSFASIALQASIGPSLFFAGKTDAAIRALEHGLKEAVRFGGRHSALAALPGLPLSEILYESNNLDRAEKLIDDTLPYSTEFGFVDQLMPGFITQARIRRARGDRAAAYRSLDNAMTIAAERGLERLRNTVVAERIKMLIQDGQIEQASRRLAEAGMAGTPDSVMPRTPVTTPQESRAMAWVRVAYSEDRISDALTVVKHWRSFCTSRGALHSLVQWDIMMASAHFISGDLRSAQRALREAITHAAASRSIRSFLDEGPTIRNLLKLTYATDLEVLHPTDAFASELLEAFEAPGKQRPAQLPAMVGAPGIGVAHASPEGLYGKLSSKEREILSLVSSGMRNREVARKLGMTEGSVKWYMQQVYDKVGTRRRLQAVERARQFGLIA